MRWVFALVFALAAWTSDAQVANSDLFAHKVQWRVTESWGHAPLVYTFEPNGAFKSSDWDKGRGQGTWTKAGSSLTMNWPHYGGVIYKGTIKGQEILGTAYNRDGSKMGTFVFRLIR